MRSDWNAIVFFGGITVSLNLVIDNTIVMSDHYLRRRDRKAFMSILAATLTTMGALVIIFFLDEKIRLNLQDFGCGSDYKSGSITAGCFIFCSFSN